jgi:hypothetical protein
VKISTTLISALDLCITGGGFPDSHPRDTALKPHIEAGAIDIICNPDAKEFTCRITLCGDDILKLREAFSHRIVLIEDHLMIIDLNEFFYAIIVNEDLRLLVHSSFEPYLGAPPVAMQTGALSIIMEKPMACIEEDLLVDADGHVVIHWRRKRIRLLLENTHECRNAWSADSI